MAKKKSPKKDEKKKDPRIGNQWWKLRTKHGRNRIFNDPQELLDACIEYFQYIQENPLEEERVFQHKGKIVKTTVKKMRAMSVKGLLIYIGIVQSTWDEYKKREGFTEIIAYVQDVIYVQKFEGAAADMLNSNIIARDLQLVERREETRRMPELGTTFEELYYLKHGRKPPKRISQRSDDDGPIEDADFEEIE